MSKQSQPEDLNEQRFFSIRVDPELRRRLEELAGRNDRSLSAEIRIALRQHLYTHEEKAA